MKYQSVGFDAVLSTPGHMTSLAARSFARLSEARLAPFGFGVGQLPVLVALGNGIADTQRDLARFAAIKQPPMAQMLARMARDGLITTSDDPSDGRVTRLALTDHARDRMSDAVAALMAGNREALTGFSEAETASFIEMLRRITANLNAMMPRSSTEG